MIKQSEIKDPKLRERIQQQVRADDLRAVSPAVAQPDRRVPARPTDRRQKKSARGLVISLIGLRRRTLDDDNFVGACKHLRDAVAASLAIDDGDKRLRWQYGQLQTNGREGVIVRIEQT